MFNENHQRSLMTRLQVLDQSLSEALQKLEPPDDGRIYRGVTADATIAQRKALRDYLAQLRFVMRRFIQNHGLSDSMKPVSALKVFHIALNFALISVEELRPSYLRGYGQLDDDSAGELDRFSAELQSLLRRIEEYLVRGEGGGLSSRLSQLDNTKDEIALLTELERIVAAHGLVELQSSLQTLVDRAASPRLEIAVFGRVSSGKSSLLNWWLDAPILPTGVNPVTAVPTRIVRGETAQVAITTAWARREVVPLEQLARYVTEEGNPDNKQDVLEVLIQLPAERLREGVCLVDTPGLGSLATGGARQTLEYLPRCDVAVLLIEAGGVITREDLDVARAVVDAGSELVVALSKADRLSTVELEQAKTYAIGAFRGAMDSAVDIAAISTIVPRTDLAARWYDQVIAPRMANARTQSAVSLKRKIAVLRETVIALLAARLQTVAGRSVQRSARQVATLSDRLSGARARIGRGREEFLDILARVPRCTDELLESAARALLVSWRAGKEGPQAAAEVEAALGRFAAQIGEAVAEPFATLHAALEETLRQSVTSVDSEEGLPSTRGRPIFDATFVSRKMGAPKLPGGIKIGVILRVAARRGVQQALRPSITQQLSLYSQALRVWGLRYLDELSARFDALVAGSEGAVRAMSGVPLSAERAGEAERDLARLRQWGADAAPGKPEP